MPSFQGHRVPGRPRRGIVLAGALCLWPAITSAAGIAPPTASSVAASTPADPAEGETSLPERTVALLRFSGGDAAQGLRDPLRDGLRERGLEVRSVALDPTQAARSVGCSGEPTEVDCLVALGRWLAASPTTASAFIAIGAVEGDPVTSVSLTLFDVAAGSVALEIRVPMREADIVLPVILPGGLTDAVARQVDPPQATQAEASQLAELDEPLKTPEELAAEAAALQEAQRAAEESAHEDVVIDTDSITVDLRRDFADFCRTGPRTRRTSKDDPKDLRPKCQRGPFWGYWQPRAFVAAGLTGGLAIATIGLYSAALAARAPYRDAVADLDDYLDRVGGDPTRDPRYAMLGDESYDELATEVSRTSSMVRQRAIVGDILLGTSVLMAGVLGIIIHQDRRDAKAFIKQEKGLRAISAVREFRVLPGFGRGSAGLSASVRF